MREHEVAGKVYCFLDLPLLRKMTIGGVLLSATPGEEHSSSPVYLGEDGNNGRPLK